MALSRTAPGCTLCSKTYSSTIDQEVCYAPCGHVFHKLCAVNSVKSSPKCPTCRRGLTEQQLRRCHLPQVTDKEDQRVHELKRKLKEELAEIKKQEDLIKEAAADRDAWKEQACKKGKPAANTEANTVANTEANAEANTENESAQQ